MPYLNIKTNRDLTDIDVGKVLKEASRLCADLLGKPEDYMAVSMDECRFMAFGGTSDPFAFLELRSIGLPEESPGRLSSELCKFVEEKLAVAPNRVYINFEDIDRKMWGWDGKTFG